MAMISEEGYYGVRSGDSEDVRIRETGESSPEACQHVFMRQGRGRRRGLANAWEILLVGIPIGNVRLCRTSGKCRGGRMTAAAAEASIIA
jgi:hypothetical protein